MVGEEGRERVDHVVKTKKKKNKIGRKDMKDEEIKEIIFFWVSAGIWTRKIKKIDFPTLMEALWLRYKYE